MPTTETRRVNPVLLWGSIIAAIGLASSCIGVALYLFSGAAKGELFLLAGLFGATALPFYGMSVAHANDRIPREDFGEA